MENYLNLLNEEKIKNLKDIKDKDKLDKILRNNIKQLAKLYFQLCKKKK